MWGTTGGYRPSRLDPRPIVAVLAIWEVAARLALVNPSFFPPPTVIGVTAIQLLVYDDMATHLLASLRRILFAFVTGSTTGLAIGLLMGWSRDVRLLLNPYVALLYPIPKIVLLPITFSLFGVTELARILTMSLAVFLLVSMYTMGGVRAIDESHVELALDNGAGRLDLFREVIVPGALPQVFSGLSVGFGLGFILIVVIEMVAAGTGLGYVIWSSWQLFTIPRLYVALFLINVIGLVSLYGIEECRRYLMPWEVRS